MSESASDATIKGSSIARNATVNFIGQAAPLLIALFTIPLLVRGLGPDRFGVLLLAWMVVGYFSLFDLGLGRALTKLVSERLGTQREGEIPALVWTGLFVMSLLGLAGAAAIGALSPWLVDEALKIPNELRGETLGAFYLLALSVPAVIGTAGLRGILEAGQHFAIATAIRIPMGAFTFLSPLAVLPFSNSLFLIVAVLVAGRIVACGFHLLACLYVMPELGRNLTLRRSVIRPLVRFGSWMTVSNVVGPIITYLDRFLIGALISVSAVAYYATPYEVVTKLWIIPVALTGVLFPAFSASYSRNRVHTSSLFWKAVKYVFIIMFPIAIVLSYTAREFLLVWLDASFAKNSTLVLQMMVIGVLFNSLAQIPSALIQGAGRPDLKAKIHLLELPLFVGLLWWCVSRFGIEGAALAFLIRIFVDTVLFFEAGFHVVPETRPPSIVSVAALTLPILIVLALPLVVQSTELRWLMMVIVVPTSTVIVWRRLLDAGEQALFKGWLVTSKNRIIPRKS